MSAHDARRTVMIVAGEASGDMHAAELVRELKMLDPHIELIGIGGEKLRAVGLTPLYDASEMNVSGFLEVFRRYRFLRRAFHRTVALARDRRPALAILVDYPGFNLRLARELHALAIPTVYYIAPQVWAWKEGRADTIRRYVDELIVAFPFEVDYFAARGVAAHFFGHPLVDVLAPEATASTARAARRTIAYLPGSRDHEVERHMPLLVATMRVLGDSYEHIVPRAATVSRGSLERYMNDAAFTIVDSAREAFARADAALVKAGTSTIEATLMGVPFAAYYRTSTISYAIARRAITVRWIAMANILAGRAIVREFIQADAEPAAMAGELRRLCDDGRCREEMVEALAGVRSALGERGAARRSARFIWERFLT